MTWTDLTADWGTLIERMQRRFPNMDGRARVLCRSDRSRFEAYLAERHNITLTEVREEIEDFLFVETLAREAGAPF